MTKIPTIMMLAAISIFIQPPVEDVRTAGLFEFGISSAQAQPRRRQARRVSRRTSRRVVRRNMHYYNHLPGGCVRVSLNGYVHHRCGGIYYRPVVQNGANVYIVVNP